MYYSRNILKKIENLLDSKEIIVITGMRRVGKTTLLQMIYEKIPSTNKVFLDIGNILEQRIFEEIDFNNIWANLKPYGINNHEKAYLFLDEIQAKPGIVKAIKYLYDHYAVKFIVTSSISFYFKNLFPESLAGRKFIFELFPLDFSEFLIFKGSERKSCSTFKEIERSKNKIGFERTKKLYEEYLKYGGFPQVVLADDEKTKQHHLSDIFNSYFEKDVRAIADFRKITAFRDLILLLMQRVGSKLDITELSSEIGVSRETIYSYISFLEGSYFISLLSPFSRNVDREVSRTRKIYFCDNGIVNYLGKVSDGALLENAVFLNLQRFGKLNYYQKRSGAEVDFILKEQSVAIEVKQTGSFIDHRKLVRVAESLGLIESYIVTQAFVDGDGMIIACDV